MLVTRPVLSHVEGARTPARRFARALAAALLLVAVAAGGAAADPTDDLREGDKYYEDQNWRKAAAAYDRAIRQAPGQFAPEAYNKRAGIYIIQKDYKGGLEFIRKIAKVQHPGAPEILEQEALMLWATDDKAGAVAVAEQVVAKRPSAFSNQALIGTYYASRDPVKTINAYEAYLQSRPRDQEAGDELPLVRLGISYLTRAQSSLRDGDGKATIADYEKASERFELLQRRFAKGKYAANIDNGLCAAYTGLGKFDQAITVCERVTRDPRRIDANGSVWFNLANAYLKKKLPVKAREAANRYREKKPNEARAFILIGDTYFDEKDWQQALDNYLKADKFLRPNQSRQKAELSIKTGKTYRRLPFSGTGVNPNLTTAITKLEEGMKASPDSRELAIELGGAYLAARRDKDALTVADQQIARKDFADSSPGEASSLYLVSGKAQYNQGKLTVARQRFEAAVALQPKEVAVRRGLVETINAQAYAALDKGDTKAALSFLDEAAAVDPRSPMTSLNKAVLAIERNECDVAQRHLDVLKGNRRGYALVYERLMGRTYLCLKKPDRAKAAIHFADADQEARKLQANLLSAEIYTEWAPLRLEQDLDEALEQLSAAVQFSAQVPEVGQAAKRNLALALFRRGWRSIKAGKAAEAAADFERATREPGLLKGTEPAAFEFSYALALLDKGDNAEASKIFKNLAAKGNQGAYLRAPYNKVGSQFFGAYAEYRSRNPASLQKAAGEFTSLLGGASGGFAVKVRDLIGSAWEQIAQDHWRSGRSGPALKALENAAKYGNDDIKRRVENNRAVLDLDRGKLEALQRLGSNPPEALVNLGILYDQLGRPKDAYEVWQRARSQGAQAKDLQKWIDAKKRIYGY